MSFLGGSAEAASRPFLASGALPAERIDLACRLAAEGKLASRRITAWLDGSPISESEFRLLWLLARTGVVAGARSNQGDLAGKLAASPAQVSGAVERLRALGFVARILDERDRRRHLWKVTEAGDELLRRIIDHVAVISPTEVAA